MYHPITIVIFSAILVLRARTLGVIILPVIKQQWPWAVVAFVSAVDAIKDFREEELKKLVAACFDFIVRAADLFLGLRLDPDDPFSDASLANALTERTGVPIRSVRDKNIIREDMERYALSILEDRSGLRLRNWREKDKVRADILKWVSPWVAEQTGLPLTDLSSAEAIRNDIQDYLGDTALVYMSKNLAQAKEIIGDAAKVVGLELQAFAKELERYGGYDPVTGRPNIHVDAEMVMLGVLSQALIAAERRRKEKLLVVSKEAQRRERNKLAVRRYRERHGNRNQYIRLGHSMG